MKRFTLSVVGILLLTAAGGCTPGGASGQSTEAACDLVYQKIDTIEGEFAALSAGGQEQPAEMLQSASRHFDVLRGELENEAVAAAWEPVAEEQIAGLTAAASGDDHTAMVHFQQMESHFEAFLELCPTPGQED